MPSEFMLSYFLCYQYMYTVYSIHLFSATKVKPSFVAFDKDEIFEKNTVDLRHKPQN